MSTLVEWSFIILEGLNPWIDWVHSESKENSSETYGI